MSVARDFTRMLMTVVLGFFLCAMPGIRSEILEIAECDAEVIEELLVSRDAEGTLARPGAQHRRESRRHQGTRLEDTAAARQIPASVRFVAPVRFVQAGHRLANGANAPMLA